MSEKPKQLTFLEKIEHLLMYPFRKGIVGIIVAFFLLVCLLGAILFGLSNPSKPGDVLFPVDRFFEKTRISTTFSDTARFKYKIQIASERLDELIQFDKTDTDHLLKSLKELESALQDVRSEIDNVDELGESKDAATEVIDTLLDLISRYRSFLLGDTDSTETIQQELNDSIDEVNRIVKIVVGSGPSSTVQPVVPATTSTTAVSPNTKPTSISGPEESEDLECDTTYQNQGNEVEYEGLTLGQNDCDEYAVNISGKAYVLVTNMNLDYAIGRRVKLHGTAGTNSSIFITEFELDN